MDVIYRLEIRQRSHNRTRRIFNLVPVRAGFFSERVSLAKKAFKACKRRNGTHRHIGDCAGSRSGGHVQQSRPRCCRKAASTHNCSLALLHSSHHSDGCSREPTGRRKEGRTGRQSGRDVRAGSRQSSHGRQKRGSRAHVREGRRGRGHHGRVRGPVRARAPLPVRRALGLGRRVPALQQGDRAGQDASARHAPRAERPRHALRRTRRDRHEQ